MTQPTLTPDQAAIVRVLRAEPTVDLTRFRLKTRLSVSEFYSALDSLMDAGVVEWVAPVWGGYTLTEAGRKLELGMADLTTSERITAKIKAPQPLDSVWATIAPCDGLCNLCHGSGHLMCIQAGKMEFWDCPACGGAGVRAMHGRPTFQGTK